MKILKCTPELIAKLPQWAQHHIAHLEHKVEQRDRALEEMSSGDADNDFSYSHMLDAQHGANRLRYKLPTYSSLSVFAGADRLDSKGVLDLSVTERRQPDRTIEKVLYVSAPRGLIEILPSCANGVNIRARDW